MNCVCHIALQVQRVLPKWLAKPDLIERDIKSNLIPLGDVPEICPMLRKRLEANGIQTCFPGQRHGCTRDLTTDVVFSRSFSISPLLLFIHSSS